MEFAVAALSFRSRHEASLPSPALHPKPVSARVAPGLVVFGEDWGAHPSSTQHLMTHMARDWRILWVNSLGLRRPRANLRDARRMFHKFHSRLVQGAKPDASPAAPFPVVAPLALPFPGSKLVRSLNGSLLQGRLVPILEAEGVKRPIVWMSLPTAVAVAGRLGERALVYYCGDDFSALDGVDHKAVARLENELAFRADLVIAASEPLAARFPQSKTIYVPHGVDFDLFARPAPRAPDLPEGRPIAGFYGSIAEWVDLDAVVSAARHLPEWDFVFIGAIKTDVSAALLPNLKFLGPRPHAVLPSYAQHWTVSLIPFTLSRHRSNPGVQSAQAPRISGGRAPGCLGQGLSRPRPLRGPYRHRFHAS